jgi:hypothetical protein
MSEPQTVPERPFLITNRYYALCYHRYKNPWVRLKEILEDIFGPKKAQSSPNMPDTISEKGIKSGLFYKDAYIYDANFQKFKVHGFSLDGTFRGLWNLWGLVGEKQYYYKFITGYPVQMTFDELKKEVLDHMCETGLYQGGGGGPEIYRQKRENLKTIEEFYRNGTSKGLNRTLPF